MHDILTCTMCLHMAVHVSQPLARGRGPVAGVGGRVGKSGKSGVSHGKGEGHVVHAGVNL